MYSVLAAISGTGWGALVMWMFPEVRETMWLGVLASPLIGLLIGVIIKPFSDSDWQAGFALSLVGLYVAIGLFATVGAVGYAARTDAWSRMPLMAVGRALEMWWGVTLSGLVFLFWPLSFANHAVLWSYQRRQDETNVAAD